MPYMQLTYTNSNSIAIAIEQYEFGSGFIVFMLDQDFDWNGWIFQRFDKIHVVNYSIE